MTNSPPYKQISVEISIENIRASGFDSLIISFNGQWKNLEWFSYFAQLKKSAQESSIDQPGIIKTEKDWTFKIKPNGTQGFEWLLTSSDFTLKIGKWAVSKSRPSIMAEIRSEMLWKMGAQESAFFIMDMISEMGFEIEIVKPSRVDLCLDILFPKAAWDKELIEYAVSKASEKSLYMKRAGKLKGMSIGKGEIIARLYDKELEIREQSKKFWMFEIWGLAEVPKNKVMMRIEFQIRREPLKELKINTLVDLFEKQQRLWAYCTKKWLKFQSDTEAYWEKRKTLPWWLVVQDGYKDAQGASPAIREKIIQIDMEQLTRQAYGVLISIMACSLELTKSKYEQVKLEQVLHTFIDWLIRIGKTSKEMNETISERRAKFKRLSIQEGGE